MQHEANKSIIDLDVKDRRILLEMDFNARMPASMLAKKIGLSQQSVDYRIKRLMDEGVIERFYPIINTAKLGYLLCRVFISFYNVTEETEKEIIAYLRKEKVVSWIGKIEGRYDIALSLRLRYLPDFMGFIARFLMKYGKHVKERKEGIGIVIHLLKRNYLLPEFKSEGIRIEAQKKDIVSLDDTEKKIIAILCENARLPIVDIAKRIQIPPHVAVYRLKKLEREGIILGYRPKININKLGYTDYKIHLYLSGASEREIERLESYLKMHPSVTFILMGIGTADVDFEVMAKTNKEFLDFIKKLKLAFPRIIRDCEFMVVDETVKVGFMPPRDL